MLNDKRIEKAQLAVVFLLSLNNLFCIEYKESIISFCLHCYRMLNVQTILKRKEIHLRRKGLVYQ